MVDFYLEMTCSGSLSDSAYQSLMCLGESADKIDLKAHSSLEKQDYVGVDLGNQHSYLVLLSTFRDSILYDSLLAVLSLKCCALSK